MKMIIKMKMNRRMTQKGLAIVIAIVLACCASPQPKEGSLKSNAPHVLKQPYVLLISIDGYRFDYTDLFAPPHLSQFKKEGTSAQALLPVYPSKTFTNHYSIITGLYAENHGIVANAFYDPDRKEEYRMSNPKAVQDGSWYGGTPLWVAAEKQGMLAASFFWPGSEADIQGTRPTYFVPYNEHIPLQTRVDQIVKWLKLPEEKRPHFLTLYFSDVDTAGHKFGTHSEEIKAAVKRVDDALSGLFEQIEALHYPLYVFIVSDHGMQDLDQKKVEYIDDYTHLNKVRVIGDGPQVLIYTSNKEEKQKIYHDIKTKGKHIQIYKREEIPARFHYSKNPRIGDLVILAKAPWSIGMHHPTMKMNSATHGFDPDVTSTMKGIFYVQGPGIKKGHVLKPFRNINIYPLIMKILNLKVLSPIDGEEAALNSVY